MKSARNYFFGVFIHLTCFVALALAQEDPICAFPSTLNEVTVAATATRESDAFLYTYEITNGTTLPIYGFSLEFFSENGPLPEVDLVPISDLQGMVEAVAGPNGEPIPTGWTSQPLFVAAGGEEATFDWQTAAGPAGRPIKTEPTVFELRSTLAPGNTTYTLLGLIVDNAGNVQGIGDFAECLTIGPVRTQSPQTINFESIITRNWLLDDEEKTSAFVGDTIPLAATASSGLPVSFRSDSTSVCGISNASVEMLGVGDCQVAAFQSGNEEFVSAVEAVQSVIVSAFGDYDLDGALGTVDIDRLAAEIANGGQNLAFDLDQNGIVGEADLDVWLAEKNSLPGDLNLDGVVNFSDFLVLSTMFNQSGKKWSEGDLKPDPSGIVGFADFLVLSINFNKTANPAAAPVPEPQADYLLSLALLALGAFFNGQRQRR